LQHEGDFAGLRRRNRFVTLPLAIGGLGASRRRRPFRSAPGSCCACATAAPYKARINSRAESPATVHDRDTLTNFLVPDTAGLLLFACV